MPVSTIELGGIEMADGEPDDETTRTAMLWIRAAVNAGLGPDPEAESDLELNDHDAEGARLIQTGRYFILNGFAREEAGVTGDIVKDMIDEAGSGAGAARRRWAEVTFDKKDKEFAVRSVSKQLKCWKNGNSLSNLQDADVMILDRVKFVRDTEVGDKGYTRAILDLRRLKSGLIKSGQYMPAGSPLTPGKLHHWTTRLNASGEIPLPTFSLTPNGGARYEQGRHRFAALENHGHSRLIGQFPNKDDQRFQELFRFESPPKGFRQFWRSIREYIHRALPKRKGV
jgi:hypothetical protein